MPLADSIQELLSHHFRCRIHRKFETCGASHHRRQCFVRVLPVSAALCAIVSVGVTFLIPTIPREPIASGIELNELRLLAPSIPTTKSSNICTGGDYII
jgi:hypothetical protein